MFMSPLSSTIVAPALPQISQDLDITQPAVTQMVLSIFLLGFACGPLCASPLSEVYGRIRVVQTWNFMYLVFNTCCGFAQTKEALIVLRFVSGLCGSATLGVRRLLPSPSLDADLIRLAAVLSATCFELRIGGKL